MTLLKVAMVGWLALAAAAARADQPVGGNLDIQMPNGVHADAEPAAVKPVRDPFWPIGYWPPPPKQDPETGEVLPDLPPEPKVVEPPKPSRPPPDWEAAAALLRFQGSFTSQGKTRATVNGQIVEEDNVIGVRLNPYIYQWRIQAIHRHSIETVPMDATPVDARQ